MGRGETQMGKQILVRRAILQVHRTGYWTTEKEVNFTGGIRRSFLQRTRLRL